MHVKAITTALAALAFASNVAAAGLQPYKVQAVKMSSRQLFGISRRADEPGYQPEQAVCGSGNTCEEACGSGYTACSSTDDQVHCFNKDAGQTCCPDKSGNSCDAGYYCTSDNKSGTWCCPDSMSLTECAEAYKVDGGLVAQTAAPESTSSSSSSAAPPTSTSSSSSSAATTTTTTSVSQTASTTVSHTSEVTTAPAGYTGIYNGSLPASNTTSISFISAPTPSPSKLPQTGGAVSLSISSGLLFIAGVAALL